MSQAYQHQALAIGSTEIRLIRILSQNAQPECEVLIDDLKSAPRYEAISYTWRPEFPQRDIILNGRSFSVGTNLYEFLCAYQTAQRPANREYLWIDQLCIDQKNKTEKNWQVGMMSSIYSSAIDVVSWLGPANEHTQTSAWMLDLLESDSKLYHHAKWIHRDLEPEGSARQFFTDLIYTAPIRKQSSWPRGDDSRVTLSGSCKAAIANFLSNTYWSRLWIVQEIMLARKLTVWWGDSQISRDGLVGLTEKVLVTYEDDFIIPHINLSSILKRGVHRDMPLGYAPATRVDEELYALVVTFRRHGCEDARDKVYGLMGIVRTESSLEVDYTLSITTVFLKAVRVMGEGVMRQAARLEKAADWKSYLETSCDLGAEMLPDRLGRLHEGPGYDDLRAARRMGIDIGRFLNEIPERKRPKYLANKLGAYLARCS